ncbi:MltA domain-containing protein [Phenylobacterium terrae]|uniref:peptidoglycan lytic exotransglycosylase n=1 Tax=Phenylobacterium terrae TaxID=2665495 RepID=A0ABW4MZ58_9CAUL
MPLRPVGALALALLLAACASPRGPAPFAPPGPPPSPPPPAPPAPRVLPLSALPGWAQDDHAAAFAAFRDTCQVSRDPAIAAVCRQAKAGPALGPSAARQFLEARFQAERIDGEGVLTAYFAPRYEARRTPSAEFSAPVRPKPADLVTVDGGRLDPGQAGKPAVARQAVGGLEPYPDRTAIEAAPVERALAWMRPEELFLLQVQGSGVLVFEDGRRMKALYAAHNGRPFVGLANPMRERGLLPPDGASAEAIRAWLAANRGPAADELMRLNPRYVFFSLAPDDGREPAGAANVPLPPGRAMAVDPSRHAMGDVFYIDADAPILAGAFPAYRRLVLGLDVGGAIKGAVRGDLYIGSGPAAGVEAGRVRHRLRLYRLRPKVGGGP